MSLINVKIKRLHKDALMPTYANASDACVDLTAISREYDYAKGYYEYNFGLSLEVPQGFVGLIFPRSSISNKEMILSNSVGIIDSGYRGEIKARFKLHNDKTYEKNIYNVNDKVCQLMVIPIPKIQFEEVTELSDSDRGSGGFGSSDVKV